MSSNSTHTRPQKSVHIPDVGDFYTDGARLVEVVGKCREGYHVMDAMCDADDEATETINADVVVRSWRLVRPAAV